MGVAWLALLCALGSKGQAASGKIPAAQFTATIPWTPVLVTGKGQTVSYGVFRQTNAWWMTPGYNGIPGRQSKAASSGKGGYVSVAEMSMWRSPRGLDYRLDGNRIIIWPYDHSGRASINLKTGYCSSCAGCFAPLAASKLPVITVGGKAYDWNYHKGVDNRQTPVVNLTGQDILVPLAKLRAYFGNWGSVSTNSNELRLKYFPASTIPLGNFDKSIKEFTQFKGELHSKSGLVLRIVLQRSAIDTGSNQFVKDSVLATVDNPTQRPILFQATRLAAVYSPSLPCWFENYDREYFSAGGNGTPHTGDKYLIEGPSCVMEPGEPGENQVNQFEYTTVGNWNLRTERQVQFRYDDGHGPEIFALKYKPEPY